MQQINHLNLDKNWVEINDSSRGVYGANSQTKTLNSNKKLSLCDCSDSYTFERNYDNYWSSNRCISKTSR